MGLDNIDKVAKGILDAITDAERQGYHVDLLSCCCRERIMVSDPTNEQPRHYVREHSIPEGSEYVRKWKVTLSDV